MKCPFCQQELTKGTSSFASVQGFGQIILTFKSGPEELPMSCRAFACSGDDVETYYCGKCRRIYPIINQI